MLTFEESNVSTKGYVVLPIEEYNKLLLAADFERHFSITRLKYVTPNLFELDVNRKWLYDVAVKKLKESNTPEQLEDLDILSFDEFYVSTPTIARAKED